MSKRVRQADPIRELKLEWLDTFVRFARTTNQPAVAEELGTSQPTVSRQIASLEAWLSRQLVTRAYPVSLTEDGKWFADIAVEIMGRLRSCRATTGAVLDKPKPSGRDIVI
jgi:DNA-binding transcriptional LysR family regulator